MKKFLIVILFISKTLSSTIFVGKQSSFNSLSSAISSAKNFDTIKIFFSHYFENNIVINKPLTIIGIDFPIFDGMNKNEIFFVNSNFVTIQGIKFQNVGVNHLRENAAIHFEKVSNCKVLNCIFEKNFFAIYLLGSTKCEILNNTIFASNKKETNSGNGVHLWNSREILIKGNKINGQRDGIYIEFGKNCVVTNNESENNLRYGLHFMFSDSCKYFENVFKKNGAGVAVMYSHFVEMFKNNFEHNWGVASYGILFKEISDSYIHDNNFYFNTVALYMEECNRSRFEKNNFSENGCAIMLLASSFGNYFTKNNFKKNTFNISTNSRQNYNEFEKNYWSDYSGYDLDRDGFGDVEFRPVNLFSILIVNQPSSAILLHSFFSELLNTVEKILPVFIPKTLIDKKPLMKEVAS